tara:strand:+ start:19260 stop:20054 length:795 start_codon:yes stop_codon:yes gene_type:complete
MENVLMIFKIHKQDNFTMINNELINDPLISAKSKAVLIYLLSKPMLWNANIKDISNHFTDGLDAIKSALNELEKNYYLRRTRVRTDKGTFKTIYDAYESKYSNPKNINYKLREEVQSGLSTMEIPLYSNTNNNNIKTIKPIDERIKEFADEAKTHTQYLPSMIDDFIGYWTEKTRSGKKFLAETKPTFEIKKRLNTWYKRSNPTKNISDREYDLRKKEELRLRKEEERRENERLRRLEQYRKPVEQATQQEIKDMLSTWKSSQK